MGKERVDYKDIEGCVSQLKDLAGNMKNTTDDIKCQINKIGDSWEGPAASNYISEINNLCDNLPDAIRQMAEATIFLASCADGFEKIEKDALEQLKELIGIDYINNYDASKAQTIDLENRLTIDDIVKKRDPLDGTGLPLTILNSDDYPKEGFQIRLNDLKAILIPPEVLKNAPYSNLSVAVVDADGNVLAMKDSHILREGGSTTKVFTGYAALKLLDPKRDKILCTNYAQNMPYMGESDVKVGQILTVEEAATRNFPGSSNVTTANIAIAIGKKYNGNKNISDEDAYFKGTEIINNYLKESGCEKTKLVSSSGVNYNYIKNKWGEFDSDGISTGEYGITASDLAMVTVNAMNDPNFASGIKDRNNDGLFFIKSGTQKYQHGIWGFNYDDKRYYIAALGFNKNQEGDTREAVSKDIYNWTIENVIDKQNTNK